MKKDKIIFWIATLIIFLMEGVMSLLTLGSEQFNQGIIHFGYPLYFGLMLVGFKVMGSLALIIPQVPNRVKEWAYAGFGFDFIAAFVSIAIVDGLVSALSLPIIFLIILWVSYYYHHKRSGVLWAD